MAALKSVGQRFNPCRAHHFFIGRWFWGTFGGRFEHAMAQEETAWREDNQHKDNGMLYVLATKAALDHPVSGEWKGYWQRRAGTMPTT